MPLICTIKFGHSTLPEQPLQQGIESQLSRLLHSEVCPNFGVEYKQDGTQDNESDSE